jgi:hypothetical protein
VFAGERVYIGWSAAISDLPRYEQEATVPA